MNVKAWNNLSSCIRGEDYYRYNRVKFEKLLKSCDLTDYEKISLMLEYAKVNELQLIRERIE